MKISRKKTLSKKQKILIIAALLLFAVGGVAVFYFYNTQRNNNTATDTPRPVNTVDYNPPTEEEAQSTSTQKDQIINDYNKSQSDQNTTNDITVTISRANQTSAGLSIGTVIDGAKSGTCTVALSRASQPTISKTFTIAYEATSGFCQESVIPIGDITSSGEWQLTVTATSDGKTSQPATQTVNISKP